MWFGKWPVSFYELRNKCGSGWQGGAWGDDPTSQYSPPNSTTDHRSVHCSTSDSAAHQPPPGIPLSSAHRPLLAGHRRVRQRGRGLVTPLAGPSLGRGRTICARAPSAAPRTYLSSRRCHRSHLPSARRLPRPLDATDASPPSVRRQRVTDDIVGNTVDAVIASR